MIPDWTTDLAIACHKRWETNSVEAWENAIISSGLTHDETRRVLNSFAVGTKPNVAEFGRARHRLFPRAECPKCSNTGAVGDYDPDPRTLSEPCDCPEGERLAEQRRQIATTSVPKLGQRPTCGPVEYIARLIRRTRAGDTEAAEELDSLPPILRKWLPDATDMANAWDRQLEVVR
jgi:hypothetical protein